MSEIDVYSDYKEYARRESNPPQETLGKGDFPEKALQIPVQLAAVSTGIDPDLRRVVTAWPTLPADIRSAILGLVGKAPKVSQDRLE